MDKMFLPLTLKKGMKIATFNIDWARKSKDSQLLLEDFLNQQDFDFLILTEAVDLDLKNFKYKYRSTQIPENDVYEGINYSLYLKGKKAYRTILYAQTKSTKTYQVSDDKTSLALEFKTDYGNVVFYSTIIGTRYNKKPYALKELDHCITDCTQIFKSNPNIIIAGDLNTSFLENEKRFTINKHTTASLKSLFISLNMITATQQIPENIDHIVIPKKWSNQLIKSDVFIKKELLSDHQGVFITLSPADL